MLGYINIELLRKAKEDFEALKMSKMAFVAHKHIDDKYSFADLINHLSEEIEEYESLISNRVFLPSKELIDELADISNLIDLIFKAITHSYVYKFDDELFGVEGEEVKQLK